MKGDKITTKTTSGGDVTGTLVTPSYKPLENDIPILD